jgi:hypothetical protein
MSHSSFLAIAKDATIIPGVHHHCDEWCDYCLVTNRCLAFRCTAEHRRRQGLADGEPTFRSLDEAVAFTRSVAEAEGTSTPELDALVAEGAERAGLHTADPLAGAALEYARQISIGFADCRVGGQRADSALWACTRRSVALVSRPHLLPVGASARGERRARSGPEPNGRCEWICQARTDRDSEVTCSY